MMMPNIVRKERILLPHMLFIASLKDCSIIFYISVKYFVSVAAAEILAAKRDKPSVALDYLDRAALDTHKVNV